MTVSRRYGHDQRRFPDAAQGRDSHIARRQEEIEKPEHPFNRIMKVSDELDRVVITTTDLHLPRRIGEALKSAFDGELSLAYDEDGYFLRAEWHRDA